jgi:hypothetical protein
LGRPAEEARGEARGSLNAKREFILKMLTGRFGPLPDGVAEQVSIAELDTLERIADELFTASSLHALLAGED